LLNLANPSLFIETATTLKVYLRLLSFLTVEATTSAILHSSQTNHQLCRTTLNDQFHKKQLSTCRSCNQKTTVAMMLPMFVLVALLLSNVLAVALPTGNAAAVEAPMITPSPSVPGPQE
jgi:hypothetical protein